MSFQYSMFAFLPAFAGILLGHALVRKTNKAWITAYFLAMALIIYIGLALRSPCFEDLPLLEFLLRGRTEFVLIGFLVSLIITMLTTKAESRGLKLLLPAFGFLIIIFYSFFPFFLPEWYAEDYKKLKTNRDSHGICRQSTDYTCGPAAAVTALGELNISSEEGELAVLSFTNWVTGTPTDQLCNALNSRLAPHKLKCKTLQITDISGIKQFPAIATIEYGFLVDHYVTILGWKGDRLIIADPIGGLKLMKKDEFQEKWRKTVIVFERKL